MVALKYYPWFAIIAVALALSQLVGVDAALIRVRRSGRSSWEGVMPRTRLNRHEVTAELGYRYVGSSRTYDNLRHNHNGWPLYVEFWDTYNNFWSVGITSQTD